MLILMTNKYFLHVFLTESSCLEYLLLDYIPSIYNKIRKVIV